MFQFSAAYTLLVTIPMLVAVSYDKVYGSGNHWFLFGTRLDQILQYFGFATIAIVSTPLAVALCWSFFIGNTRDCIITGVFLTVCIVVSIFFTLIVLD